MTLLVQLLVAMALTMVRADNLDRLPFASVGDRLPPGWQVRPVRGVGRPTTAVVEEGATRAIRFEATREAAWHWVELESEQPGRITAVGFMIDTDATGDRAVSLLGELKWLPGPVHEDRGSMSALTTRPVATASSASLASFKP